MKSRCFANVKQRFFSKVGVSPGRNTLFWKSCKAEVWRASVKLPSEPSLKNCTEKKSCVSPTRNGLFFGAAIFEQKAWFKKWHFAYAKWALTLKTCVPLMQNAHFWHTCENSAVLTKPKGIDQKSFFSEIQEGISQILRVPPGLPSERWPFHHGSLSVKQHLFRPSNSTGQTAHAPSTF